MLLLPDSICAAFSKLCTCEPVIQSRMHTNDTVLGVYKAAKLMGTHSKTRYYFAD